MSFKHWPDEQLEAVAGSDALATVERTQPPSLEAARVLLDDRQNVALAERQLLRGFRDVVVQRLGHQVLDRRNDIC